MSENLAKAKRDSTRIRYTANIKAIASNLSRLVKFKIVKKSDLSAPLKQLLLIDINPAAMALIKEAAEKELKKEIKARAKEIKESIASFRAWGRGHISRVARDSVGGDLIRFRSGGQHGEAAIETSQGVIIPIAEALKLRLLCQAQIKANGTLDISTRKIGHTYSITSIDAKGNAKIGCHFFKFEEIERCFNEEYSPTIKN